MLLFLVCVFASFCSCVRAFQTDECVKMVNVVQIVLRKVVVLAEEYAIGSMAG